MAQRHDENYNEQPMTRMGRIQQPSRRYRRLRHPSFTAAIWTANNPLLQRGEIGGEIDTHRIKMGDGVTYWNDLPYASDSIATWGNIQGDISEQTDLQGALDAKQDVLTAGTGISIDSDNVISNSGVRSVATGTTNGTISVNTGGTSAEVSVYGLGSAAYTSSSDYATAAQGAKADNAANKDLSNLTSTGANISNWSSNVSNCITEIPQDIKLELSNGTLTLKAGSVLTDPTDGTRRTTTVDRTTTFTTDGQYMLFVDKNTGVSQLDSNYTVSRIGSGSSLPADGSTYRVFYNSTDRIIYRWAGTLWVSWGVAFPLCVFTVSGGAISSVDQIFNGFGYIGSTVFALPGVKMLMPNGKKSDGTLNNTMLTIPNVITQTFTGTSNTILAITSAFVISEGNTSWYNPEDNYTYYSSTSTSPYNAVLIGKAVLSSGVVSNFSTKPVFTIPNRAEVANLAMPSKQYVELTLGSDGASYIAPADGYFTLNKGGNDGQWYYLLNNTTGLNISCLFPAGLNARAFLPAAKGDTVRVHYTATGATNYFRFVYANGAK